MIVPAIDAARSDDPHRAKGLVGRSSGAIAVAAYHLRAAKRQAV